MAQRRPQHQQQVERFYRHELEELANTRAALRAQHRPKDNSDSEYSSWSDSDEDRRSSDPRKGPTGYVDFDKVEAADLETHIPETNVGYRLLLKMGWKAGTGLGQNATGRTAPIPIERKQDVLGIGKQELDTWYAEATTAQRKRLEAEKQAEETLEAKNQRVAEVEKRMAVKAELDNVKAAFYCSLCDKQYERISEYEVHLSSYDHNHKKRFKEMKEMSRAGASSANSKAKEKEKRREEKELAKLQEAAMKRAGGGQAAPTPAAATPAASLPSAAGTSGFQPLQTGGFQPVQTSGFQPVQTSGFQPVQTSGFQPVQSSGFQPVKGGVSQPKSGGFQPVKTSGFQPVKLNAFQADEDDEDVPQEIPAASASPTSTAAAPSGFQPVQLGGFKPMKLGGFQPVKIGGFQIKKPGTK